MTDTRFPDKADVGQFPYNLVRVWPDGRELHLDYTPGNNRTRYFTSVGTGFEINNDGRFVFNSMGGQYHYSQGGTTFTTDLNHDHKVSGGSRTSTDGGEHSEVGGHCTKAADGAIINLGSGTYITSTNSGNHENILTGDQVTKIEGNVHLSLDGDEVKYITGNHITSVTGEDSQEVNGNQTINISGASKIIVGGKLIIQCSSLEFDVSGDVNINSSNLYHNGVNVGKTHVHTQVQTGSANSGPPATG